jgi:hypothetical protein
MFNWYTAPTFAAALLFWLLAAYVLTRSRRDAVSSAAFVALAATAVYLFGEAMEANAPNPEVWLSWARGPRWGATLAPAAWYWLTILVLRSEDAPPTRRYVRWIGYPVGIVLLVGAVAFTAALYAGDSLWWWSAAPREDLHPAAYLRYNAVGGDLYPAFILYVVLAALGAAANLALAWRASLGDVNHRRSSWLLLSLALFAPEVGSIVSYHWLGLALPTWLNHLALAAAMAVMATNVSVYHYLRHGQTIRADLLYFIAGWTVACAGFGPIFLFVGGGYSFQLLGLLGITLALLIVAHALADPVRRDLDRLFFGSDVQRLRSSLSSVVQNAALTQEQDFGALLSQAQSELQEVSAEHVARLTQEALRRLNAPAGLADCALGERLPHTLAEIVWRDADTGERPISSRLDPTPLERARALRAALVQAVERLKPPDDGDPGAPAALQYHILHEAYVFGRPNKQIMVRRGISEGTFHRNRREAVSVLARELLQQEERLADRRT